MKKLLLCISLMLAAALSVTAQEHPVDSLAQTLAADEITEAIPDEVPVAVEPSTRTDSMLNVLESKIDRMERQQSWNNEEKWVHGMARAGMITGIIITAMGLTALVLITFLIQKYRYQRRLKAYELERWRLENGIEIPLSLPGPRRGTGMVKFLMFLAIVAEIVILIVWLSKQGWIGFFPNLFLLVLMGVLGVVIKELFLYLQNRDQNPQA